MTLLIGTLTISMILALLSLGVFLSYKVFNFPDITADGTFALGAAVAAILIVSAGTFVTEIDEHKWVLESGRYFYHDPSLSDAEITAKNSESYCCVSRSFILRTFGPETTRSFLVNGSPYIATFFAVCAGMLSGSITGLLHTRFKIEGLLSGILVMTGLYSVNLFVMGKSNISLLEFPTLVTHAEALAKIAMSGKESIQFFHWTLYTHDIASLIGSSLAVIFFVVAMNLFLRTNTGTAMRATGDNPQMIRAMGVDTGNMIVLGLAISNGLVALSGALLAQYQGFADVQMGIGMIVLGLASVILGQALIGSAGLGLTIIGAVVGSVLFRLLVSIALTWGLNPNYLKLITAGFVFAALVLPGFFRRLRWPLPAPG